MTTPAALLEEHERMHLTIGVWTFVVGSFLALISAVGKSLVRYVDAES